MCIKNLNDSVDDKALLEYFAGWGKIILTKVIYDSNGLSRGFGFVRFSSPKEAQKVVATLNDKSPISYNLMELPQGT